MGKIDEDLLKVLRIKAAWGAIYAIGTKEAQDLGRRLDVACNNFVHHHAYEILGLYHLHQMHMEKALIADELRRATEAAAAQDAIEALREERAASEAGRALDEGADPGAGKQAEGEG